MSQWADNADRLNQWAESRRQFFFREGRKRTRVCVCLFKGERSEGKAERWKSLFLGEGGLAAGGENRS